MRTLVESLKRLFEAGKVTDEKLLQMVTDGKITADEKTYIEAGSTPTPRTDDELLQYYNLTQGILPEEG